MSKYLVAFSTTDSEEEAGKIAKTLVEEGFVAGINIVSNLRSIYKWQGEICDKKEFLLIMKTTLSNENRLKVRLKELHHYETPELIFIPITDGLPDYLNWLEENCT